MTDQERMDHLSIAALQQAVQLAAARPDMATHDAVQAAEAFLVFLNGKTEKQKAA